VAPEYHIDYMNFQLPVSDKWLYANTQYPEIYSLFFSRIYYLVDASDALLKS